MREYSEVDMREKRERDRRKGKSHVLVEEEEEEKNAITYVTDSTSHK